jgi:hypothetical protein
MAEPAPKKRYFVTGDPGDLGTSPTLPKSREVIQIKEPTGALTLHDRRLFNHLIAFALKSSTPDEMDREHAVPLSAVRDAADLTHESSDDTKASVERLQRTLVQWNDGSGWNSVQLLGHVRIKGGVLHWRFDPALKPYLSGRAPYARLSLQVIYHLSSKYAITLYENLMLFAKREHPVWEVSLTDFRAFLGVAKDAYPEFAQLKRRVIDPALAEIGKFSPLVVSWDVQRQKRLVKALVFRVGLKTSDEQVDAELAQIDDMPLLQPKGPVPHIDTPETRRALALYLKSSPAEQMRLFNEARRIQRGQDGVDLITLPMADNPETWIHYLVDNGQPAALPDLSGESVS